MIALLLIIAVQALTSVDNCDTQSLFKIYNLTMSPSAPVANQNATLYTDYEVFEEIKTGTATYACTLNGIPVLSEKYDICTQTACPITVGLHNDTSIIQVPSITGTLVCKIKWVDSANRQLLCIQTKIVEPLNLFAKWF